MTPQLTLHTAQQVWMHLHLWCTNFLPSGILSYRSYFIRLYLCGGGGGRHRYIRVGEDADNDAIVVMLDEPRLHIPQRTPM